MKITVPVSDLLDGLRKVLNVVSARATIPILGNVLLHAEDGVLSLSTTDLEVSITTRMNVEIEGGGEITLPAKTFGNIIGKLPTGQPVVLDTDETLTTTISCGAARFKIMGMGSAEFPKDGDFQETLKLTLPKIEFGKTLKKIAYSASTDQTRYILNGILLSIKDGNFTSVATDGRRLALVEKILDPGEAPIDGDAVLPIKAVNELQKILEGEGDVVIRISDSRASFEMDNSVITTKLVEGNYPNYRQVIPASFDNSTMIPREVFAEVLDRVSVVLADSGASVKFKLDGNNLELSASSSEIGEASEPMLVSYDGNPLTISFNPGYLKAPLRFLDCDELTMRFNDQFKPVVILGDEGFLYVIMPMRN